MKKSKICLSSGPSPIHIWRNGGGKSSKRTYFGLFKESLREEIGSVDHCWAERGFLGAYIVVCFDEMLCNWVIIGLYGI